MRTDSFTPDRLARLSIDAIPKLQQRLLNLVAVQLDGFSVPSAGGQHPGHSNARRAADRWAARREIEFLR
jgi:hypothetical protein